MKQFKTKLEENISSPIIPDAMSEMLQNKNAIQFHDKKKFDKFKNSQKYFSLSKSHCFYTKNDLELFHKGIKASEEKCEMAFETGHKLAYVWDDKNSRGFIIPSDLIENELNKIINLIKEELFDILCEISPYDYSLIPKDKTWDEDSIAEFLNDKESITQIILEITPLIIKKNEYNDLMEHLKILLIDFILKYNLNTEGEVIYELEKLDVKKLEEFMIGLKNDSLEEYNEIKKEFVINLLDDNIIRTDSFGGIK